MISLSGYLVFLLTFAIAAAVPGPGIAAVIARTLSHGALAGMLVVFGTILGDVAWLTVAVLGLAAIANTFAVIFLAIKYLGALYLFYLAWKLWTSPPPTLDLDGVETKGRSKFSSFWIGLSVSLSNPKTIMFYMAILPTLIDIGHIGFDLYVVLVSTITVGLIVILGAYVVLTVYVRNALTKTSAVRALQRGTSVIMAGAAAMIATR